MKTEIIVPRDKCPLDVIAEMGEKTKNAWFFISKKTLDTLNPDKKELIGNDMWYYWYETDKFPQTILQVEFMRDLLEYVPIIRIYADDIAFKQRAPEPEDVFFIKSE